MTKKRSMWISLASALLAVVLVYAVYELQLRHIQAAEKIEVIVPKQFIDAGTMLEASMLERISLSASAYHEDMATSIESLIGKETIVPLGQGEPVLDWKLDRFHLQPNQNQSTFQIPKSYILSVSSGIRAGDSVIVYLSDGEGGSRRLFDESLIVASVKSSAYMEVDNAENSVLLSRARDNAEHMYVSRRDASAPIDHINLNMTERQWLELDAACNDGKAKLVIAYTSMPEISQDQGEGRD